MEQDQQTNQDRQQQQQPELNGRPQAVASDTDGEGSVSLKRKFDLLQDSSGTSPTPSAQNGELDVEVDSEGDHQQSHQQQTSSSAAQRALIARTAPHLLESQNASLLLPILPINPIHQDPIHVQDLQLLQEKI